ncbi:lysosome-associated membrane glycoprotein 5 isoform X2 [Pristis pectinata]|uniref:lysosome-associated membrane glycoprotein 5 isoform X2 n=1 Tax=Pristis pectinata TaxID=685728 RepID=UPI00223DAAC1|nr:lysosome-associated membrane glycoprotein 5 isoform X2 [Pristis pectinata]
METSSKHHFIPSLHVLAFILNILQGAGAEQETENLSGLSTDPYKDIFVVRENGTTCLMAEFAAKFIVAYDARASNYVDLITEQADISIPRSAEVRGKCGSNESELQISWADGTYSFKIYFVQETRNTSTRQEQFWKVSKVQFVYDLSESSHFKDAANLGRHTATSRHLSLFVTPLGKSYKCEAQESISLISSDHQKVVAVLLSQIHIQPFGLKRDFTFSEASACVVDQQEQLEETLPLILGLTLGLVIVVILSVYHIHHKLTATSQIQIPRDRSEYKHM